MSTNKYYPTLSGTVGDPIITATNTDNTIYPVNISSIENSIEVELEFGDLVKITGIPFFKDIIGTVIDTFYRNEIIYKVRLKRGHIVHERDCSFLNVQKLSTIEYMKYKRTERDKEETDND